MKVGDACWLVTFCSVREPEVRRIEGADVQVSAREVRGRWDAVYTSPEQAHRAIGDTGRRAGGTTYAVKRARVLGTKDVDGRSVVVDVQLDGGG